MIQHTHRYFSRITIEAATPLLIASGNKGLTVDKLVAKDANNLPYIPGTSLKGVLRNTFGDKFNPIFGEGDGEISGSRLLISSAHLLTPDSKGVIDGLMTIPSNEPYYRNFNDLPERDHVKISDKGSAVEHAKFDEQVVYKGTRFVFEIELIGTTEEAADWQKLLNLLASPTFRLGSGTRKGLGKIKIVESLSRQRVFDLTNKNDLSDYLNKTNSLNSPLDSSWQALSLNSITANNWAQYTIQLKANDFFLFGSGLSDEEADSTPKKESFYTWDSNGKAKLVENHLLIPATSIKGALAHRVAYHYNLLNGTTIESIAALSFKTSLDAEATLSAFNFGFDFDSLMDASDSPNWEEYKQRIANFTFEDFVNASEAVLKFQEDIAEEELELQNQMPVLEGNTAVRQLFGFAKNTQLNKSDEDSSEEANGLRGRVIIDDIYIAQYKEKVLNHTKIDRFTNGTIDGALFQEKVTSSPHEFEVTIWVDNKAFEDDSHIKTALTNTFNDLINGRLALGGHTSKGHGTFTGSLQIK